MVDVGKRHVAKPWTMHDDTPLIKRRFYDDHLPAIKPVGVSTKQPLPGQHKQRGSTLLPAIKRGSSTDSTLINGSSTASTSTTNIESSRPTLPYNVTAHEAAKRFILRNNLAKFAREFSPAHGANSPYARRKTLYNHVQAKINTGLPRTDSIPRVECDTHPLEPVRPMNWHVLKHEVEKDVQIRAHTNRIQFNSGVTYATQLTTLGDLVRSKVKSHITSVTGSGDERYKIVVHLTIFPTTASGLHVASRCLWNTHTDNSITIKMQGVDCDILIVIFLCYTEL